MKVVTKPYGAIEVDNRQKISFPYGILGFENLNSYLLLDAVQQPFYWLQSLDVVEVAFVLINPRIFNPDYSLDVPKEEYETLRKTKLYKALYGTSDEVSEDGTEEE